jgi:outer membrane protein OmpA-like peptidoglycan-associated protein
MSTHRLRLLGAIGCLLASFALLFVMTQSAARRLQSRETARNLIAEALAGNTPPERQDALFQQARAADPTYDTSACELGIREERAGHWREAAAGFRACIVVDPQQAYAHLHFAENLLYASGPDSYLEIRTHLRDFLDETEGRPPSPHENAARRAIQDLVSDLEDRLTGDNPHPETEPYTADEIVLILLRSHVRGPSRYEGPRLPLHLGFHAEDFVLGDRAEAQLPEICRALRDGNLADALIQIEGHTDCLEGRTQAGRKALGARRAEAVRSYLVHRCGIAAARLSIKSFADEIPLNANTTETGRAANRRVELFNLRDRETLRGGLRR